MFEQCKAETITKLLPKPILSVIPLNLLSDFQLDETTLIGRPKIKESRYGSNLRFLVLCYF